MQEKDISSITYFEKNVRIADLLNVFIFDGEQYLQAEDIQERNRTDSVTKKNGNKKKSWTISRDIVRQVSMQMRVVLVALENQSDVHYAMPVRVIMGDSIQYHKQWREIAAAHAEKKDFSNLSEDAFDFIGEFAYARQLKMMKKMCESKEAGGYDMCKAIDVHTHMFGGTGDAKQLVENMNKAGVYAATVFSKAPNGMLGKAGTNQERLEELLQFTEGRENLYPFYFIDPTEDDAIEQLEMAKKAGVKGFKVMCTHYYPGDERAMKCYHWMAEHNMPAMFHSGILYDGINPSGKYNRPCEFEPLLSVNNFRFSLAHLSWPWTDECIAVFGKFHDYLLHQPDGKAAKMYLDITPGTPPTYRENAFHHLFGNGFPVEEIVIWGSDNNAQDYSEEYSKQIMDRDYEIFNKLGVSEKVQEDIFCNNYLKFLEG